jgi:hypothetical protein
MGMPGNLGSQFLRRIRPFGAEEAIRSHHRYFEGVYLATREIPVALEFARRLHYATKCHVVDLRRHELFALPLIRPLAGGT